jgi:glutamate synthase domain-containing protein 1
MCGIVGLHLKTPAAEHQLGALMIPMLEALTRRGPDSTGIASYRHDLAAGEVKYSLRAPGAGYRWPELASCLEEELGDRVSVRPRADDAVLVASTPAAGVLGALARLAPDVRVFGHGRAIEVVKDVGGATAVCHRYGIAEVSGYQGIGHTRMATESAVTTEHSHPFSVGPDLALVHNGSFSNHATIRRRLAGDGIHCETDNDSEVAARYVARQLSRGADLADALRMVLKSFDGFFTLLVSTETEFAILRDSFACKPAVVAEHADYVAVASEYIALADLPGITDAQVFEPMPEEVHVWSR